MNSDFQAGDSLLLVNTTHIGMNLPPEIAARSTVEASALPDTDCHVHRLANSFRRMGVFLLHSLPAGKSA